MAKKDEVAKATEETKNVPATIPGENGKEVSVEALLKQLEEAEVGTELTSEYWSIEPGEEERIVLMEMTEMNKMGSKNGEMTDAVMLLTSSGVTAICADKVIVSTAKILFNKGKKNIPVFIQCTGKVKGVNGTYKQFSIKSLLM